MATSLEARCPFHTTNYAAVNTPPQETSTLGSLRDLPGPKGLPFLGNLLELDLKRFHSILEGWASDYGPMYKFKIAGKPVVVVSDPDLVHEVSKKRPSAFRRLEAIELVLDELGINGVFSSEGERWQRQRRLTMQALNAAHLQSFFPTLVKMTERLMSRWNRAANHGVEVEVRKDLMRYTIDVTSNLAFGFDVNALDETGNDLQRDVEQILPMLNRRINAPFPYWHFFKLPADRALDSALASLRRAVGEFIAHSRRRLSQHPELANHPTNFLEAMLAAQEGGEAQFTDHEIFGNIITMLVAGEDTTAYTLAWMIHFLADRPEVQARLQQETDRVLRHDTLLQDFRDHERLSYLQAVAYETLRMKSVVPVLLLQTNHEVRVGGVQIPERTPVFLLLRHAGLQEDAFVAAREFNPERWLVPQEERDHGHCAKAFMPFGVGPRFCPGRNLALLEIKAVMSMLCRNFSISKAPHAPDTDEQFAVVMMPTDLMVNLTRRMAGPRFEEDVRQYVPTECPYAGLTI